MLAVSLPVGGSLPVCYKNDPAGYRKAAKPHYEAAAAYGIYEMPGQAKEKLRRINRDEAKENL